MIEKGLAARVLEGDERSAGRLISLIEEGTEEGYRELRGLFPFTGRAQIIGITGPPGAGKSTLTGGLALAFSKQGKKVGVVACDPTSVHGTGALLGDRLRMKGAEKRGIFIRSMAHRGCQGGVARAAAGAVYVLEGLGKETILVESVGAGQAEKGLSALCDTVVIVFTPDYGDEIQLLKAGLMEIGDILVVNKGDFPGAPVAVRELSLAVGNRPAADGWTAPVVATRADRGEGLLGLAEAIEGHWRFVSGAGLEARRRAKIAALMAGLLREEVWNRFGRAMEESAAWARLVGEAMDRRIDPYSAVERIVGGTSFSIGEEGSGGQRA